MFKPKTTITGRLENGRGAWTRTCQSVRTKQNPPPCRWGIKIKVAGLGRALVKVFEPRTFGG